MFSVTCKYVIPGGRIQVAPEAQDDLDAGLKPSFLTHETRTSEFVGLSPCCAGLSLYKSVIRRHATHHLQGLWTN